MMLDYQKILESLLRELIDKKIISEWYCNGAGYFWKYNEKDKRKEELEKENAELRAKYLQATDLIEDMYDKIPASHSDYYKDVMERARQFIKDSEV